MAGPANRDGTDAAAAKADDANRTAGPPTVSSSELLGSGRELLIRHGHELYRFMITSQKKLILTK